MIAASRNEPSWTHNVNLPCILDCSFPRRRAPIRRRFVYKEAIELILPVALRTTSPYESLIDIHTTDLLGGNADTESSVKIAFVLRSHKYSGVRGRLRHHHHSLSCRTRIQEIQTGTPDHFRIPYFTLIFNNLKTTILHIGLPVQIPPRWGTHSLVLETHNGRARKRRFLLPPHRCPALCNHPMDRRIQHKGPSGIARQEHRLRLVRQPTLVHSCIQAPSPISPHIPRSRGVPLMAALYPCRPAGGHRGRGSVIHHRDQLRR